jgi:hypothetical protein
LIQAGLALASERSLEAVFQRIVELAANPGTPALRVGFGLPGRAFSLAFLASAGDRLAALIEELRELLVQRRVVAAEILSVRHLRVETIVREVNQVRVVHVSPDLYRELHDASLPGPFRTV